MDVPMSVNSYLATCCGPNSVKNLAVTLGAVASLELNSGALTPVGATFSPRGQVEKLCKK